MTDLATTNRTSATRTVGMWLAGIILVVVAGLFFIAQTDNASAGQLDAFPVRITYELDYQAEVDRNVPLVHAKAVWDVRSFSDWDFEFLTGPDSGTIYSIRPNGVFASTDGRTSSSTQYAPGTEMIPLPDMAFDTRAQEVLADRNDLPGLRAIDRGASAMSVVESAASKSGLSVDGLRGAVFERDSSTDAFEFDASKGDWVGADGVMRETIVVDSQSLFIVLREQVFEGELLRRVAVIGVEGTG